MAGKPRSAKQIAAQRKAAKASAAKRSKASSKSTPMRSHDAPGGGNKPIKDAKKMAGKKAGKKPVMSDFKMNPSSPVHPQDQWEAHRKKVAKAHGFE